MLKFNELRINREHHLIIDFTILDVDLTQYPYYDSISIEHIKVGVGSEVFVKDYIGLWDDPTSPYYSENAVFEWKHDEDYTDGEGNTYKVHRGFRLNIDLSGSWSEATVDPEYTVEEAYKNLIYVEINVEMTDSRGEYRDCLKEEKAVAYAYDRCLIVNSVFDYIKSTANPCVNLTNYANYIVQIKGLEIAIEAGNFTLANKFWTKFFMNNNNISTTHNCCCH